MNYPFRILPITSVLSNRSVPKMYRSISNRIACFKHTSQCNDAIMSTMASQITSLTIVYSTVYLRRRLKKTSKLRVTGLCEGNSPAIGEFPAQRACNAENVYSWWRHHQYQSLLVWRIPYMDYANLIPHQISTNLNFTELIWYDINPS